MLNYVNIDLKKTGQVVSSKPGAVYGYYFYNQHATDVRFVKLYNKASAADANDTPIAVYPLPPKGGANRTLADGLDFDTGLSVRAVTGVANNDATDPTTNDVIVNFEYIKRG